MSQKPLRIAIMGTRGIPAAYGGFETFAEELSLRLVERGHEVTVYCRRPVLKKASGPAEFKGVKLVYAPTVMQKYLETPLHSLTSFLQSLRANYDVLLLCNAANSPFAFINLLSGRPLAINVDGIERFRTKWNRFGKLWYYLGEFASVYFGKKIVADAEVIAGYYRDRFKIEPEVIAYGADEKHLPAGETLCRYGLTSGNYLLYVSRLEPENNALGVIKAYCDADLSMPLVVVGDAPYADEYKKELRRIANNNVIFTGYQFGDAYRELRSNCSAYVQATEVGGTHPALLEAMAHGNCVIANDVPEHREVLGEAGLYYPKNDFAALTPVLQKVAENAILRERLGRDARQRVQQKYNWESITDSYEALFLRMTGSTPARESEAEDSASGPRKTAGV